MTEQAILSINDAVRGMYEAFPYPDYSLFVPLRWQEAYASGSLFAQRLVQQRLLVSAISRGPRRILIAGCGDIQTAIISRWEPRVHRMAGIDLSQSSLQKARLRSWLLMRPMDLWRCNLEDPRVKLGGPYFHIDAYGMLHHLANPRQGLQKLSELLVPGGTMRIMVYNSRARHWIFQLSRVFAWLGLSAFNRTDLKEAGRLLKQISSALPALHDRLEAMTSIIEQPSRLVDTFFHEREARLSLEHWLQSIQSAGLEALGLMDRYAELDDLPNPLLQMPTQNQLQTRIDDLRFENNLEFYLYKPSRERADRPFSYPAPWNLRRRLPPLAWVRYEETQNIGILAFWQLWQSFLTRNFQGQSQPLDRWARRLAPATLQRLSRLGALFPDQLQSRALQRLLYEPMQEEMEAPRAPEPRALAETPELQRHLERILLSKNLPLTRLGFIAERLQRAQKL